MVIRKLCCYPIYCLYTYHHSHFYIASQIKYWSGSEIVMTDIHRMAPPPICFVVTSDKYFCAHKCNRSILPLCVYSVKSLILYTFLRPLPPSQLLPINQYGSILQTISSSTRSRWLDIPLKVLSFWWLLFTLSLRATKSMGFGSTLLLFILPLLLKFIRLITIIICCIFLRNISIPVADSFQYLAKPIQYCKV